MRSSYPNNEYNLIRLNDKRQQCDVKKEIKNNKRSVKAKKMTIWNQPIFEKHGICHWAPNAKISN